MRSIAALILLAAGVMGVANAGDGLRAVHGSVEAARLFVDPGPPVRVRAITCPECPNRSFLTVEDAEFFVGAERIPRDQLTRYSGQVGTVIFDLESERAVRLRWIPAEDIR